MVLFPLLSLLLLSSVEEVTASALLGRQRPSSDGAATLALDKREETTDFITFATIFDHGNPSWRRTAESGYDIRVDMANSAWGFCGSDNPGQCDMAGVCVDSFSCSRGCGFGNTLLKTWTCDNPKARYCSTALLTVSTDSPRAVTYLACADKPAKTDEYKAFTTTPTPSASPNTAAIPLPTPQQTSRTATTDTPPSQTDTQSVSTTSTGTATPDAAFTTSTNPANDKGNNENNSNDNNNTATTTTNTAMIVGATVGCVALICICIVAVFLIRRSRGASAAAAAAATTTTTTTTEAATSGCWGGWGQTEGYKPPPSELQSGDHVVHEVGQGGVPEGWGAGYTWPAAAPVELSGTGGWSR